MFRKRSKSKQTRRLKPLPKRIIKLYGLIAIIFVLIPEWIAESAIAINQVNSNNNLPKVSSLWATQPELLLATMNFRELRALAMQLKIHGYANENKAGLSRRLLKTLNRSYIKHF